MFVLYNDIFVDRFIDIYLEMINKNINNYDIFLFQVTKDYQDYQDCLVPWDQLVYVYSYYFNVPYICPSLF